MPFDFKLPDLGEGITEAELRKWLVKEGDTVREHQPVAEVETDKAVVEVPSPRGGRVGRLARREGETVEVGATLFTIEEEGEAPPERPKSVGIVGELPEAEEEREIIATPLVRKLARERGIDLATVRGSGPRGSITPDDLQRISPSSAPQPTESFSPVKLVPLRGVRRAVARNVMASQRNTAFVTGMEEADITELWELRRRELGAVEARGAHLTFLPFFIKAVQHALQQHPYLNATIDDAAETIIIKRHYHFGIAVETPDGLMVPVIRDVDRKSIIELAAEIQELGSKARKRTISLDELKGSTFTLTNYGHFGGVFATPIINWPDVAILGFGRIGERPWIHKGQIAIRRILPLSLTFDHRVTDGADAAQFLLKVVAYLEDPALLFIEST
ncbi:2-oxo acid dehydrogenase subunit E2 [Geobacter hydrogenophilus]|uniref:Dihydrolipoamide acetyltransferase component of pyruvate dehydrogenase complex n=1 Tax=Geobacter hydrogenophilus TaxID=40983 RepID=A0A9W6G3R1_9BACT|nr:dihydrolipoamide acetyltransferase family protein [Geobacter hydrogenophilus]MBT0892454.1 2-oxo acid dehydrogenase subunit E2 [Geobacter hydrogenophilus]GLI39850.1 dihydrolipoamide acetyltransferase component of pyruvate dehydrogenase complex [Geobacter hydrogenophilus]